MESDEYVDGLRFVDQFSGPWRTRPPCAECPTSWAAEQAAVGHCNGTPRGG